MLTTRRRLAPGLAAMASLALLLSVAATPAAAADYEFEYPAGLACDFALGVEITMVGPQNHHVFEARDGTVLGELWSGRGNDVTLSNGSTGASLSLDATGAVTRIVNHEDGTFTQVLIGQNVLILYPTDVPAGPSTTLHIGRVVISVDAALNYTVRQVSGRSMDICAALS